MKKSKRLLALLLSVMLIFCAVMSVPFTANAANVELTETGAYSLRFDTLKINGQHMQLDKDYYCMFNPDAKESEPLYAVLDTEEAGYYVLYARNSQLTTGNNSVAIGIVDEKEILDHSMGLANGEESELAVRLEANTRYYVKLCYNYEQDNYGSLDLKLSYFADAEPDEIKPEITVNAGQAYEGSIDVAEDKDWIFVSAVSDKKHSITLDNLNEDATAFKAEVYDTKSNLIGTVTTENEDSVTLELAKPSEVISYYICVTGINTNVRGEYSVKMDEVKPVATNVPLNEEFYDSITGYGKEGSRDYLKFTTIDKDAYYTITVKNISIETHTWSKDAEVQADILNAQSEKIGNLYLTEGQEKSTTSKLEPNTTYYMQVYNNYLPDTQGGNYKVQISYVLDPDKNEKENATDWTLEEKYYGDLAAGGDHDWFKITTNEETDYTFTLKNTNIPTHSWSADQRFRGVLYNDKNEELTSVLLFSGDEGSSRVTLDPNTTYYIKIYDPQNTTGEYSFDLSKTVIIDEEAVGMANAVEIPYNEDYYDSITNWDGDNKTDYLKFTTLEEPAYYTLTVKNINIPTHPWHVDYQVQVKLWNEHKEELTKITLSEDYEASTTLMLDPNTTYYVRINNNEDNGGNYKVKLTYVTDPEPNTMEEGKLLRISERYYSSIAASGDVDFFKITTNEATDYTLLIKNINIESHSWASDEIFRVVLMNKYSEILSEVLATTGKEEYTAITLEPNTTYYLKVVDPWNTKGDYNVLLAEGMLLGDVNLDEAVKIQDATLIQKYLAKLATLEGIQISAADVTEDGKVNIKDATAIQKYLAKLEIPYKVGQLILAEIEYSEPATEATVATEEAEPVTTTAATLTTEPTEEAPVTTVATEPTEVPVTTEQVKSEPTETTVVAPQVTTPANPVETTATQITETITTDPEETTAPEEEQLSNFEQLKVMVEECAELSAENGAYEGEAPLEKNSRDIAQKADFGFDLSKEDYSSNEYYKFKNTYSIYSYNIFRGYDYTEQESLDILGKLKSAYDWFKYYVTEVHPTPSGRVIYFKNTVDWKNIYVYYFSETADPDIYWPGVEMKLFDENQDIYWIEIPAGYDQVQFNNGALNSQSVVINLNASSEYGFSLNGGSMSVGSNVMTYQYQTFSYNPHRLDL